LGKNTEIEMNKDQINAGAEIHAGDGGYEEGTQEKYEEFVMGRNASLAKMRIKELGDQVDKWFEDHSYSRPAWNEKFAELIVQECIENIEQFDHHINPAREVVPTIISQIKEHFGVEK